MSHLSNSKLGSCHFLGIYVYVTYLGQLLLCKAEMGETCNARSSVNTGI